MSGIGKVPDRAAEPGQPPSRPPPFQGGGEKTQGGGEKTARSASLFGHRERSPTGPPDSLPGQGEGVGAWDTSPTSPSPGGERAVAVFSPPPFRGEVGRGVPGEGSLYRPGTACSMQPPPDWPQIRGGLAAAGGDIPDDSPARRSYPSKSFPGGSPAHGPGRPRRRGNPNPAKPLADRALPATENCPSDHGPVYAPRPGPHRSQRQGKGRVMDRKSPRADRREGVPASAGFRKPRVFNGLRPLAADRGAVFGVFSARFGPFLSGIVRDSPAKSGIVRDSP